MVQPPNDHPKRRSVREYTRGPIPPDDFLKILETGRWAPLGYNRQPWEFIVITHPKTINELKIVSSQ